MPVIYFVKSEEFSKIEIYTHTRAHARRERERERERSREREEDTTMILGVSQNGTVPQAP